MKILDNTPKELLTLKNPPKKLFYKGDLNLLDKTKIAIIGSRKMSTYTKNLVLELSSMLRKVGVCVVSGGALGVDINAHKGAYPSTIAIFANGLDVFYPQSNANFIKQIYENALALSENEATYWPKRFDFILRNRLIIGLCDHIIIAQADLASGSYQSANLAHKMGKKLFVLPHRKGESDGTNHLLECGKATLINDFDNFASSFGVLDLKENDEILDFCKNGVKLEEALKKFKDKIYEYELDGKLTINGVFVKTKS